MDFINRHYNRGSFQSGIKRASRRGYARVRVYRPLLIGCLCALLGGEGYAGPPLVSQYIGTANPVTDEFGELLLGTAPDSGEYGIPPVEGDLVQVLHATDGVIHPPGIDGNPHPNNVLILTSRIGWGISPVNQRSGKFSAVLAPRPEHGTKLFVRVFNAASLSSATFYGNSQLYSVNNTQFEVFMAEVGSTDLPLDPRDPDGDGINNSWEQSLAQDADNDGLANEEELLAGTDMNDENSLLEIASCRAVNEDDVVLRWDAVPGKTYQVEFRPGQLVHAVEFVPLKRVVAESTECEVTLPGGLFGSHGYFRLCVIESER